MSNSAAKRSMVIGVLRVLIVIIAICCLGLQVSAIAASAGVASKYADADSMHWLYAVAAVLIVACFESALVPLWRLLTLVEKTRCLFRQGHALGESHSRICGD